MNHIYHAGRCIFCNSSDLDNSIYDEDETCTARDEQVFSYTSSSSEAPKQSHGSLFDDKLM